MLILSEVLNNSLTGARDGISAFSMLMKVVKDDSFDKFVDSNQFNTFSERAVYLMPNLVSFQMVIFAVVESIISACS